MNLMFARCLQHISLHSRNSAGATELKRGEKTHRKLLKVILLWHFRAFFYDYYQDKFKPDLVRINLNMESYAMDMMLTKCIIRDIIETGDYTLEGIATYTRIPMDVILDAACGSNTNLSITFWAKLISLYIQVKPDVLQEAIEKLLSEKYGEVNLDVAMLLRERL